MAGIPIARGVFDDVVGLLGVHEMAIGEGEASENAEVYLVYGRGTDWKEDE